MPYFNDNMGDIHTVDVRQAQTYRKKKLFLHQHIVRNIAKLPHALRVRLLAQHVTSLPQESNVIIHGYNIVILFVFYIHAYIYIYIYIANLRTLTSL